MNNNLIYQIYLLENSLIEWLCNSFEQNTKQAKLKNILEAERSILNPEK